MSSFRIASGADASEMHYGHDSSHVKAVEHWPFNTTELRIHRHMSILPMKSLGMFHRAYNCAGGLRKSVRFRLDGTAGECVIAVAALHCVEACTTPDRQRNAHRRTGGP